MAKNSSHSAAVMAIAKELGNPHVSSRSVSNADGFGTGKAPADTAGYNPTGNKAGAPYHSSTMRDDGDTKTRGGLTNNPYSDVDQNQSDRWVLGPEVLSGVSKMIDSPASKSSAMPDRHGNYKADAVSSVTTGSVVGDTVRFPTEGVLGRS